MILVRSVASRLSPSLTMRSSPTFFVGCHRGAPAGPAGTAAAVILQGTRDRLVQELQPSSLAPTNGQVRFRWTKAKKKRHERYHRRQEIAARGEQLPKPPYFFPVDTPVVNAIPKQQRLQEAQELDARASEEFRIRLRDVETRSPVVLRHHMSDNVDRMSDRVRKLLDLRNGSQKEVVKAQKYRAMQLFEMRPGDTGSSAVQVVALTNRIQQLTTHFQKHHKDKHGKRGLAALYVRRRKLLDYMERKDFDSYRKVVNTLGLVR